jgi:hypothetical protein
MLRRFVICSRPKCSVKKNGSAPFSVKETRDGLPRKSPRRNVLTCLVPSSMVCWRYLPAFPNKAAAPLYDRHRNEYANYHLMDASAAAPVNAPRSLPSIRGMTLKICVSSCAGALSGRSSPNASGPPRNRAADRSLRRAAFPSGPTRHGKTGSDSSDLRHHHSTGPSLQNTRKPLCGRSHTPGGPPALCCPHRIHARQQPQDSMPRLRPRGDCTAPTAPRMLVVLSSSFVSSARRDSHQVSRLPGAIPHDLW